MAGFASLRLFCRAPRELSCAGSQTRAAVRASAMTMDLYGHLVDDRLWEAARAVGGILGVTFGGKWQEIFAAIWRGSRAGWT